AMPLDHRPRPVAAPREAVADRRCPHVHELEAWAELCSEGAQLGVRRREAFGMLLHARGLSPHLKKAVLVHVIDLAFVRRRTTLEQLADKFVQTGALVEDNRCVVTGEIDWAPMPGLRPQIDDPEISIAVRRDRMAAGKYFEVLKRAHFAREIDEINSRPGEAGAQAQEFAHVRGNRTR